MHYTMIVDLDERGLFRTHVEDEVGRIICEISNQGECDDDGLYLVGAGYMRHKRDADGLLDYLISLEIVEKNSTISVEG